MNLLGGDSRCTPYTMMCIFILFCVCLDLYHAMIFNRGESSFRMSVTLTPKIVRGTTCRCFVWAKHHETLSCDALYEQASRDTVSCLVYEGGSRRTLKESRGGPSGKKPLFKGFRLVVNSVVFSHVAVYSLILSECRQPVQCHRPCVISLQSSPIHRDSLPPSSDAPPQWKEDGRHLLLPGRQILQPSTSDK